MFSVTDHQHRLPVSTLQFFSTYSMTSAFFVRLPSIFAPPINSKYGAILKCSAIFLAYFSGFGCRNCQTDSRIFLTVPVLPGCHHKQHFQASLFLRNIPGKILPSDALFHLKTRRIFANCCASGGPTKHLSSSRFSTPLPIFFNAYWTLFMIPRPESVNVPSRSNRTSSSPTWSWP